MNIANTNTYQKIYLGKPICEHSQLITLNTYQEVTKLVSKQIITHTFNKVYPYRELINNIRNVTRL